MKRILTAVFATTLGLACAKGDTVKRCRNLAALHHLGGLRAEAQARAKPGEKVPGRYYAKRLAGGIAEPNALVRHSLQIGIRGRPLVLAERRSGYVIILLGSLLGTFVPVIHFRAARATHDLRRIHAVFWA